uniref:Uncharacterized protein n=1 Tax=Arundo donax TaxID=35708 RepID=A0A0A9BC27_ARUDO
MASKLLISKSKFPASVDFSSSCNKSKASFLLYVLNYSHISPNKCPSEEIQHLNGY